MGKPWEDIGRRVCALLKPPNLALDTERSFISLEIGCVSQSEAKSHELKSNFRLRDLSSLDHET